MKKVKKQLAHLFDATQCINCGACVQNCPFGAIKEG